jgi:two-component system, cell cycle response regulator
VATDIGITAEHIAAARLRLVLDAKLGRTTPDRIHRIAAMTAPDEPVTAGIDPLTGLLSKRAFENRIGPTPTGGPGRTEWLLLIDVDTFKKLNDSFGHRAGDAALRETGRLLTREAGAGSTAARFGGDEFVVLVTTSDGEPDAGVAVAERLRAAMAGHDWQPILGAEHRLHVSIGVTAVRPGEPLDAALRRADGSMYAAKRQGGNRVVSDLEGAKSPTRLERRS